MFASGHGVRADGPYLVQYGSDTDPYTGPYGVRPNGPYVVRVTAEYMEFISGWALSYLGDGVEYDAVCDDVTPVIKAFRHQTSVLPWTVPNTGPYMGPYTGPYLRG